MQEAELELQAALNAHRAGLVDEAASLYQGVLAENPSSIDALVNLAALYGSEGRLADAEALYRQVLGLAPGDAQIHCNLGNLLQTMDRLDEAEHAYRAAVDLDAALAPVHANLAMLEIKRGRPEAAIRGFEAAIAIDPFLGQAHTNLAALLNSLGQPDAAAQHLEEALLIDPEDVGARYNLGLVRAAAGAHDEAERIFRTLATALPQLPEIGLQLAKALSAQRRPEEALPEVRRILAEHPDYLPAWHELASVESALGSHDTALEAIGKARALDPANAVTSYQEAQIHSQIGDVQAALACHEEAYGLAPELSETRYGLATVLQEAGDNARAKEIVEALIAERPDYAEAYVTRGNVHAALDRPDDAIRDYQTAIGLKPGLVVAHYNLGHALRQSGRLQDAKASFEAALGLDPELASAYNGLGALCQQLAEHEKAVEHFDKALAISPGLGDALNNKAISLQMLGRYREAVEAYKAYITENPGRGEVYFNFGGLLQTLEQWEPSLVVLKEGLAQDPGCLDIYPFYLHALMQLCDWSNLDALIHKLVEITKTQLAAKTRVSFTPFALQSLPGEVPMALRRQVAEAICERISDSVTQSRQLANFSYNKGPRRQRLTIGYVSPDLRAHSVAVAFRGIMENHDRDRFTYNAYSLHPGPPDPFSQYFRTVFDSFVDAAPLSHEEAARQINDDGVDILVDLAGHTRGTRLEIFALRPAPVQAHYLGYSATVGARFLDYLITDHQQVPAAERRHFTEQLVYLPDSFMAARRADVDTTPPSRAEEGLPEDGFVFTNFNKHYKHEPKMFGLAMRLLKQWPGSVYWLRHGTPQSDGNLRREAAARGVDPERLIFAENKPHPKHLARLGLADLALDNFYHGGGVTTVDALWVGLPVLSLAGQTPQSRNGASLLSAIGMAELIAERTEDFEAKARQLLGDPTRLADVRRRLLENRVTHPLFDIGRLTRKLEQAYEMMWEVHAAGDPPRMIEVPADD